MDWANIRVGPSVDHEVLRWAPRGFPFLVLDQQEGWSRVVDFRNREGWVATRLLAKNSSVILKISRGYLYSGPEMGAEISVAEMDYGTIMQVKETEGEWLKVANGAGVSGWLQQENVWP